MSFKLGEFLASGAANAISGLVSAVGKEFTNKEEKAEALIKAQQVEKELLLGIAEAQLSQDALNRDIIVAEAGSDSWLTRMWRPIAMLTFLSIFPATYMTLMFGGDPTLIGTSLSSIPDKVWLLLTVGIGGYLPLRTIDKAIKNGNGGGLVSTVKSC